MGVSIENNINVQKKIAEVSNAKLWAFAGREWYRLMFPFIPFRTGAMASLASVGYEDQLSQAESIRIAIGSGNISAVEGGAEIRFSAPYAKKQYYGNFNWRTDLHGLATGRWDVAAEPTQRKKLIKAMQAFIKRGVE